MKHIKPDGHEAVVDASITNPLIRRQRKFEVGMINHEYKGFAAPVPGNNISSGTITGGILLHKHFPGVHQPSRCGVQYNGLDH